MDVFIIIQAAAKLGLSHQNTNNKKCQAATAHNFLGCNGHQNS